MKAKLSMLFVLFMIATNLTQAQSKKEVETKLNDCVATKDSIQNLLTELTATHDSVQQAYDTMYTAIKEKVFLDDFDPLAMSDLIDSLRTEASFGTAAMSDSISTLKKENAELSTTLDELKSKEDESAKLVADLKQLKELLDEGILTQEEFDKKKEILLQKL
jgi:uncharacterized protein YukE